MELVIERACPEDAGELMTVQRAAFLIEGELNDSFTLPPMTETKVTRYELTGATSENNLRMYRRLGYCDIGRRPAAAAPGLAYLEKRV
jgi:hypothetical protein